MADHRQVAAGFDALVGELDYPMFIATVTDGDRRAGCLVGFATQGSIDPPRFLVCLSKKNHTYLVARHSSTIAMHVPTRDDMELATLFGTETGFRVDKFARCAWRPGPDGVPVLTDCAQWFIGRIVRRFDTGDHEGLLLEPHTVGTGSGLGQLGFQEVRDLDPGNEP